MLSMPRPRPESLVELRLPYERPFSAVPTGLPAPRPARTRPAKCRPANRGPRRLPLPMNTQVIEPNNIQARQPLQTQYQDRRPRSVLAVQDNQSIGCQASPTPLKTWADLFRNMKVVP
ncbi:hypothetical protein MRX96_019535 [Rhipicephalus microplus]